MTRSDLLSPLLDSSERQPQSLLQQANLFACVDVFRLLALVSFACILGVFLMKKVSAKGAVAMH